MKTSESHPELKHLLESTSATALFLTRGVSVVAIAGGLSNSSFLKLAASMQYYWQVSSHKDINQYVGLALDSDFYLVHAKHLPRKDVILGLVFPLKTPLSCIRKDMAWLMRSPLVNLPNQFDASNSLERSLQFIPQSNSDADLGWLKPEVQSDEPIEDVHLPEKNNNEPEETEADAIANKMTLHTSRKTRQPGQEMTPPPGISADLTLEVSETSWQPVGDNWLESDEKAPDSHRSSPEEEFDHPGEGGLTAIWQPLAELHSQEDDLVSLLHDDYDLRENLEMSDEERFVPAASADPVLDERLSRSGKSTHTDNLDMELLAWTEEVSDVTFYLVPGHDSQYLLGDLAHRLRDWLPVICTTYGWELDFLSIRPDYMKWTLRDFPESLILEMLRIVREQLSEKIFHLFPHLFPDNQLKDFWSPGYLVDTQNREFSTQALITHVSSGRLAHSNPR